MIFTRWLVMAIVPITALLVVLPLREVFELPKTLAMQAAALFLIAGLSASALLRRAAPVADAAGWLRPGPDRGSIGVLFFLASAALSTLFASSPRTAFFGAWDSFFGLCTLAAAGVFFFAARHTLREPRQIDRLLVVVAASSVIVACSALAQALGLDPVIWRRTSELEGQTRIFGSLGHPNHLAAFLAMSLPLQLHRIRRAHAARRWLAGACWSITLMPNALAVLLAQSRAGWLAFGAALLLSAVSLDGVRGWRTWLQVPALGVGVGALVGSLLLVTPALRDDADSIAARVLSVTEVASNPRREIWRSALGMLRQRPWLGVGADNFGLSFGLHRTPALWQLEPRGTPSRAHNELLHVAATQGMVGIAASAWLLWCVISDARVVRRRGDTEMRRLAALLLLSLGALALSLATGFLVAATTSLAAVEAGALAALARRAQTFPPADCAEAFAATGAAADPEPTRRNESRSLDARSIARGALACVVVGISAAAFHFGVVRMARAELEAAEGQALGSIGALVDASDHFVRAVNAAPWIDRHWVLAGTAFQLAAASTPDPAERAMLLDAAHRSHATAAELVPASAYAQIGLGRALAMLADENPPRATHAQVEAAFERGLALDPLNLDLLEDAERTARLLGETAWAEVLASRRRAQP